MEKNSCILHLVYLLIITFCPYLKQIWRTNKRTIFETVNDNYVSFYLADAASLKNCSHCCIFNRKAYKSRSHCLLFTMSYSNILGSTFYVFSAIFLPKRANCPCTCHLYQFNCNLMYPFLYFLKSPPFFVVFNTPSGNIRTLIRINSGEKSYSYIWNIWNMNIPELNAQFWTRGLGEIG